METPESSSAMEVDDGHDDKMSDFDVTELLDVEEWQEGQQETSPAVLLQEKAALFLAHMRENCYTTQAAIDQLVQGVDKLFVAYNDFAKDQLFQMAEGDSVKKDNIHKFFSIMEQQSIFEGVHSKYMKMKYAREKWKETITPIKVVLSYKRKLLQGMVKEVPHEYGYTVPFLAQLEVLLQCDDYLNCIDNPIPSEIGCFRSSLDGFYYQTHPVTSKYPNALAFVLYVDDITPSDVLSSYQDSGLRNYSWSLANVYPALRSSLRAINLLALAPAKTAKKYKNEPFLKDFIQGINRLSSEEGVTFNVKGANRVFHGFLLFVIGDYPASANLGGFKESSSKAYRPCRQCMVLNKELGCVFDDSMVTLRSATMHSQHIASMDASQVEPSENLEEEEDIAVDPTAAIPNANLSVEYGVNSKSCLLQLTYFDVTKCLPQDVMHLFLEGILEIECRFVLRSAVEGKLKLSKINDFFVNHDYGNLSTDKPSPIEPSHLKSGLHQNSSQMLLLSSLIPFVVQGFCDSAKLKNFVRLLMIVGICLSHSLSKENVVLLNTMVRDYLMEFQRLYPGCIVSKHHFLIHLALQILLFGPLTEQWAMRYEAFHSQMKRLAKILHNSKNLSFSLITRLLAKRSLEVRIYNNKLLSSSEISFKKKGETNVFSLALKDCVLSAVKGLSVDDKISILTRLKWHGFYFQEGKFIVTSKRENGLPVFGCICNIYCHGNLFFCTYKEVRTVLFCPELNCYKIRFNYTGGFSALLFNFDIVALMHIKHRDDDYIVLRSNCKPEYHAL